jgi:hypothetical protein
MFLEKLVYKNVQLRLLKLDSQRKNQQKVTRRQFLFEIQQFRSRLYLYKMKI